MCRSVEKEPLGRCYSIEQIDTFLTLLAFSTCSQLDSLEVQIRQQPACELRHFQLVQDLDC